MGYRLLGLIELQVAPSFAEASAGKGCKLAGLLDLTQKTEKTL
jgi:hypothetical protein